MTVHCGQQVNAMVSYLPADLAVCKLNFYRDVYSTRTVAEYLDFSLTLAYTKLKFKM
jgi:hypothetical protein